MRPSGRKVPHLKLAIFVDYDGTITIEDTVDLVLDTYGAADWRETSHRLDAEGAGDIERMSAEFVGLDVPRKTVTDLIRETVHIDETFKDFLEYTRARGWEVVVLSQGVRESLETVFEKYGIEGVEWHANALGGPDGRLHIEFPERATLVDEFYKDREGVYKPGYVRRASREGFTTIYVGDGMTDRGPAEVADIVFAKRYLKKYMAEKGLEFIPFETFADIRRELEEHFPAEEPALE